MPSGSRVRNPAPGHGLRPQHSLAPSPSVPSGTDQGRHFRPRSWIPGEGAIGRSLRGRTLVIRPPVTPALSVKSLPRNRGPAQGESPPVTEEMGRMGLYPDLFDELRVVTAGGELDVTTVPAFARDLEDARHGSGRLFLIVDLLGVTSWTAASSSRCARRGRTVMGGSDGCGSCTTGQAQLSCSGPRVCWSVSRGTRAPRTPGRTYPRTVRRGAGARNVRRKSDGVSPRSAPAA